ncbi:DUF6037 family protein [uncultured Clostridium sp.]|uniref:DUF6037 family protein n=1 Tax=uncultured Clostridium sp. TaxID=59620 RepID=UPI0025F52C13|nr:DUF6037 family protein [uncultured Clostridium sp.]MDU4882672.1 DUF6037 family protein [Clostridium celatum]MDU7076061.1 DUF6037 family protein [Clostridium celatum]
MEYSYSGVVDGLKEFYSSMRNINVEIGTFRHEYNNVLSDVIFDTRSSDGWKLIFIKHIDGNVLEIQIQRGYRFAIEGNMAYNQFREYFGIGSGKGEFSIKDFVRHLSGQVPLEYRISDEKRNTILRYDKLDNESDGIYPIGLTNWEVVHAKNQKLPNDKYHRTAKNLAKTKQLYPEIYEATKNLDITIIYGVEPSEKTGEIKLGKL